MDREDAIERVNWYGAMVTGIDEQGIVTNSSGSQLRRIDAAKKMWPAVVHRSRQ